MGLGVVLIWILIYGLMASVLDMRVSTNKGMVRILMIVSAPAGLWLGVKAHRLIRDTIGGDH